MREVEISILMPAYNVSNYISQSIESCINQSFSNFEIIVVDDASTDNTRDIVTTFNDDRIKLLSLSQNSGPANARNFAISHSRGRWITVLDADDVWHPNRLTVFNNMANRLSEKSILFDEIQEAFEDRTGKLHRCRIANSGVCRSMPSKDFVEIPAERLIMENLGAQPFFARKLVVENKIYYPEGIRFGEDFCFLVKLLNLQNVRLYQICKPFYYRRIRRGSLTAAPDKMEYREKVYDLLLNDKNLMPSIRNAIEHRKKELLNEKIYLKFKILVMHRKWNTVLSIVRENPFIIRRLIKGLPVSLPYRLRAYILGSKIR